MKKIFDKEVLISFNNRGCSLDSIYKNCHYIEEPEQYNQLICTDDFDKAFDFIKNNNFKSLSVSAIGKIKMIHYTNLSALANYTYFKFNFKSLVICEQYADCSNDFSIKDLSEVLPAAEFIEYCKNKKLEIEDIIK